jgi:hypothetical protein
LLGNPIDDSGDVDSLVDAGHPDNLRCTIAIGRDVRVLDGPATAGPDRNEWRIAELTVRDGIPSIQPMPL